MGKESQKKEKEAKSATENLSAWTSYMLHMPQKSGQRTSVVTMCSISKTRTGSHRKRIGEKLRGQRDRVWGEGKVLSRRRMVTSRWESEVEKAKRQKR